MVAVGGGKGGVGKSVVAANLSIAIARLGMRVTLVDADLGAANQHTLFGIGSPGLTLQALLDKRIDDLEEAVVPTSEPRVFLVPGSGAVVGAANIGHARKMKLIRHVQSLDADVVVVDCGAGSGFDVVDFYDMADLRFVVVTPQLTSMQNAYAFLKSAVYRAMRKAAVCHREQELIDNATEGGETERLQDIIARVAQEDESFASDLTSGLNAFQAYLVGNQLEHLGQQRAIDSLSRMFHDFLGVDVPALTSLPRSSPVHMSVSRRRPILMDVRTGPVAAAMMKLAETVVSADVTSIRTARRRQPHPRDSALPGPTANHLRAHQRYHVEMECTVQTKDGVHSARMMDASGSGARLTTQCPAKVGETLSLIIEDLTLRLVVRRNSAGEIGAEWESDPEPLFALLSQAPIRASA